MNASDSMSTKLAAQEDDLEGSRHSAVDLGLLNSAIYQGKIRHRRFQPLQHEFTYPIFMLSLDLDEIDKLIKSKWYVGEAWYHPVRYKRSDFFNPEVSDLKQAVIQNVESEYEKMGLKKPVINRIQLLTHVRYLNLIFNPVSFYYCYNAADELIAIQAEITNTPWKERHSYVLPITDDKIDSQNTDMAYKALLAKGGEQTSIQTAKHQFQFSKKFHVSPFNPMAMDYRWVFSTPKENLLVQMDNTAAPLNIQNTETEQVDVKHFDATLTMEKTSIEKQLARTLIRYPLITVKVVMGIYWQALKLFIKRSPFYSHPESN